MSANRKYIIFLLLHIHLLCSASAVIATFWFWFDLLACLATSVPAERLFSISGMLGDTRLRQLPKNLENRVIIKANKLSRLVVFIEGVNYSGWTQFPISFPAFSINMTQGWHHSLLWQFNVEKMIKVGEFYPRKGIMMTSSDWSYFVVMRNKRIYCSEYQLY